MAPDRLDESVSPMTRTPNAPSPANAESQSRFQPPKSSDGMLAPTPDSPEQQVGGRASPKSTGDYWNNGKRHPDPSPLGSEELKLDAQEPSPQEQRDIPAGLVSSTQETLQADGGRTIQFAEPDFHEPLQPPESMPMEEPDTPTRSRTRFMSKIKAFAANGPQTPKSLNGPTFSSEFGSLSIPNSPTVSRVTTRAPDALNGEQSDADADVETADEAAIPAAAKKNKRKSRRFKKHSMSNFPNPSRFPSDLDAISTYDRLLRRRASMPDTTQHDHAVSDGEIRDNPKRKTFRRGHSFMNNAMSPPGEDDMEEIENSAVVGRRNGHLRRITVFGGGGLSDGDALTPKRHFFKSDRASSYGAQKWKQVKSTLKLLRQKKEDRFDYYKSAELMAELRAGAPAVLMLASMIQRDEHGNKRIPVLLEQLKLRIKDSKPMPDDDKERHWIFTIELEYGSGPSRMNWCVIRTIRDIYNLHFRYKFALNNDKYMLGKDLGGRPKQPKFPYSAFPYLRGARNKGDESEEDDQASGRGEETGAEMTAAEDAGEGPHHHSRKKSRSNFLGMRRRSTGLTDGGELSFAEGNQGVDTQTRRQRYVEKQRRILEKYLSEMIRWLMFRADSNRLCRFLELSALGVRLAAEGSYHGKEGYLHLQMSKGLDFRHVLTPAKVISRQSRKWFLVRQSYIVCVESPENMNIYDVYLVDTKFSIVSKKKALKRFGSKNKDKNTEDDLNMEPSPEKHHTLKMRTSDRKIRLFSRYQSVMRQFEDSINEMLKQTVWYEKKRFDSFAPVRTGVFAQWLVDGRDYMWNVSRAINMARDVIYIHDWWLSPELYMRRPACISQKWRLDRLLQKKAREGVKVFVIIYRNVEAAVPIDSEYTKFSLLNLHPNIFVQRSPNQFKKNQFFFAHHEKICIVDHDVAFLGGIDLCFGRWDSPQHPIVDDKPTGFEPSEMPKDAEHVQLFPGKDYSNPRVQDFFNLNEPYEEMYDRSKVPRMPWHDISMQVVGQPARDLTRHFVQRWNYLRRGRKPTRPLPFLLPPPDAKFEDLEALGLTGTCEVQMLRSASNWSLGINETEHSIQTAYVHLIEESDHFVYMENQFFITSTEAYGTRIVNRIGDALVDRIIRAHQNNEDWRCVILIPLMPGFQNTVDEQEGTSVRLIIMCQYRSICRGEHSIFGRLRAAGIEPEDYISFYSLRQWGMMSNDVLVTEQLYIHAKTIIVDDRVALIGSANINERSLLGSRDSEVAAIVRDTDMIASTMAGKPYKVGRFAHTLRMRLMREHLGLDVDEILEQEREEEEMNESAFERDMDAIYEEGATPAGDNSSTSSDEAKSPVLPPNNLRLPSFNHDIDLVKLETTSSSSASSVKGKEAETDPRVANEGHQLDVSGYGPDHWKSAEEAGVDEGLDTVVVDGREMLLHGGKGLAESHQPRPHTAHQEHKDKSGIPPAPLPPASRDGADKTDQLGLNPGAPAVPLPVLDDTNIGGPAAHVDPKTGRPTNEPFHPMAADILPAVIHKDCMRDPLDSTFVDEIWNRAARNNTLLYRRVFRCMPDSKVGTWAEYREYMDYNAKFRAMMEGNAAGNENELRREASRQQGAAGDEAVLKQGDQPKIQLPEDEEEEEAEKPASLGTNGAEPALRPPPVDGSTDNQSSLEPPSPVYAAGEVPFPALDSSSPSKPVSRSKSKDRRTNFSTLEKPTSKDTNAAPPPTPSGSAPVKRRRRATTKGSRRGLLVEEMPTRNEAEQLLGLIQGHLVEFPYDWLLTEEHNGNWGYQVDGVAPIAI
ncbi:Phospholipase D1 [Trichoderma ghanense]|uniref:Phospholipase n=1 Tax=Trichoderma ghanense TaxID=65468 RepID=A0ABY2HBX0_9HYPO